MSMRLTFEGENLPEIFDKMQETLDRYGLLPQGPPPVGDEDYPPGEDKRILPFGEYGQPRWAEGAAGLIWVKVAETCWPRVFSNLTPEKKLPVFKNPPPNERQILDPLNPNLDEVLIYNKRFIGDKNSGDTNVWVETAEHGALNITEIIEADRKRV